MTRIFLDFDGVLRRNTSPRSRLDVDCVERFEQSVLAHDDARVVIASTWRLVHRLDALRALFSEPLRARIEGVTPNLPEVEDHARHAEIQAYLQRNRLAGSGWVAVDDDAELYRPGAPLVQPDPESGFDERCARELAARLARKGAR